MVEYRDGKSFVMADIPGIIEGASKGKGLGLRFLRHIERNALLLFVIPVTSENIRKEYDMLVNELIQYNPQLADKRRVLAISKSDMVDEEQMKKIAEDLPDIPYVFISSITGFGIQKLKDVLWETLDFEDFDPHAIKKDTLVHRNLDITPLKHEEKEENEDEDEDENTSYYEEEL
jgi:GTP-binding protein